MPRLRSPLRAVIISSWVCCEKFVMRRKPTSGVSMQAASTLRTGTLPRVTVIGSRSGACCRWTASCTFVPRLPRSIFMTESIGSCRPATSESLIRMIRSPFWMPAFWLGPCGMTFSTTIVSVAMLNMTPMPSNSPSSGSFRAFSSEAGI